MSKFGRYTNKDGKYTFQNVVDDRNAGSYRNFVFLLVNSDIEYDDDVTYAASLFNLKVYIDNLRIVPTTGVTVSDF